MIPQSRDSLFELENSGKMDELTVQTGAHDTRLGVWYLHLLVDSTTKFSRLALFSTL